MECGIGMQESEVRIQNTEYRMVPAIWKLSSALKGLENSAQGFNPGEFSGQARRPERAQGCSSSK